MCRLLHQHHQHDSAHQPQQHQEPVMITMTQTAKQVHQQQQRHRQRLRGLCRERESLGDPLFERQFRLWSWRPVPQQVVHELPSRLPH